MNRGVVYPGQNLYDIAIQYCGSAEIAHDIARLNNISVTDILLAGTILILPDVVAQKVVDALARELWQPATTALDTPIGVDFDLIELDLEIG